MALHAQTYQPWDGPLRARPWRALALAAASFRLTWSTSLVRVALLLLYTLVAFWLGFLLLTAAADLPPIFAQGNHIYRDRFYHSPLFHQILMILTAVAGSGLVSRDRKADAFSTYFSKAIGSVDYVAAKSLALQAFLALGIFVPGLLLWIGNVTTGRGVETLGDHATDLMAIAGHSLVLSLPAGSLMLLFSSLSRGAAGPAVAWILLYEGSEAVSAVLSENLQVEWAGFCSLRRVGAHLADSFYENRPLPVPLQSKLTVDVSLPAPPALVAIALGILTLLALVLLVWRLRRLETDA